MNAQQLKDSILQYAMRGKIVEQREKESAKELLEKVEAKKKQLVMEGKIKKEEKQPEVSGDEVLFDIPESWEWTRMSNIADMYTGNSIPKSIKENKYSKVENGYNYIGTKDIGFDCTINYDNGIKIPFEEEKFRSSFKDSILMCIEGGSAGRKIAILDETVCFGNKLCSFNLIDGEPRFLYYYLQSPWFFQVFRDKMSGIIGGVSISKLKSIVIPLPPLEEQRRIVTKIEEILSKIESLELNKKKIDEMQNKFPMKLENSILHYAMQGKLVQQEPSDEPANELVKRIREEKARLVEEKVIKKEKSLLPITAEEIPFDIPENWEWVRLGGVINLVSGQDFPPEKYNHDEKGTPYITGASTLTKEGVILNRWTEVPQSIAEVGDLLLVCKGSGYGKTLICNLEIAHIARQIMAIKKSDFMDIEFIEFYLQSNLSLIKKLGQGVIPGIDRKSILNLLLPLPPLKEQSRIVNKIKETHSLLNKLRVN